MSVSLTAKCGGEDECYCSACSTPGEVDVQDAVGDLAAAIRRGDTAEAEYLLDRIASDIPGWTDRVSLGRYSPKARAA